MSKTFTDDALYKSAMKKAEKQGMRKPDKIFLQLTIPFDCYEAFIERFYEEYSDLKYRHTSNKVTKADVLANLMWLFGKKYDANFSKDILKQIDPNMTRPANTGRKSNNPLGRKPTKHIVDLFEDNSGGGEGG